jgi:hypothetical protein
MPAMNTEHEVSFVSVWPLLVPLHRHLQLLVVFLLHFIHVSGPWCVQILNRLKMSDGFISFHILSRVTPPFYFMTYRVMHIKCSVYCIILQVQTLYITCPFLTVIFVSTLNLPPKISYNCHCL